MSSTHTQSPGDVEKGGAMHDEQQLRRAITPGGHPVETSQPAFPVYHRKIGDPTPLGLFSFASTCLVLSLYNAGTRGINTPNVMVGMTLATAGIAQLLSGIFNFIVGNTFAATVFTSYASFWMSFGLIYWPSSGILAAYADVPDQLASALGIFLITWFIFTIILIPATFKASLALFSILFFLSFTFLLLAIGEFQNSAACHKAGGIFGVITAFCAYYTAAAGIYTPEATYFTLPVYDLVRKDK